MQNNNNNNNKFKLVLPQMMGKKMASLYMFHMLNLVKFFHWFGVLLPIYLWKFINLIICLSTIYIHFSCAIVIIITLMSTSRLFRSVFLFFFRFFFSSLVLKPFVSSFSLIRLKLYVKCLNSCTYVPFWPMSEDMCACTKEREREKKIEDKRIVCILIWFA